MCEIEGKSPVLWGLEIVVGDALAIAVEHLGEFTLSVTFRNGDYASSWPIEKKMVLPIRRVHLWFLIGVLGGLRFGGKVAITTKFQECQQFAFCIARMARRIIMSKE